MVQLNELLRHYTNKYKVHHLVHQKLHYLAFTFAFAFSFPFAIAFYFVIQGRKSLSIFKAPVDGSVLNQGPGAATLVHGDQGINAFEINRTIEECGNLGLTAKLYIGGFYL